LVVSERREKIEGKKSHRHPAGEQQTGSGGVKNRMKSKRRESQGGSDYLHAGCQFSGFTKVHRGIVAVERQADERGVEATLGKGEEKKAPESLVALRHKNRRVKGQGRLP